MDMSETPIKEGSLTPGQEAYIKLGEIFDSLDLVEEGTVIQEKRKRTLEDGKQISAERMKEGHVGVTIEEGRNRLIDFGLDEQGLYTLKISGLRIKLGGVTLKGADIAEYNAPDKLANASKPLVDWFENVVRSNQYIDPATVLTINQAT